jgi:CubicO group peptidase (beta-lactamase class C family)
MHKSLPPCVAAIVLAAGSVGALALECDYVAPPENEVAANAPRSKGFKAERSPGRPATVMLASAASRPRLDVDGFFNDLDATLRSSVAGFVMQLRRHGSPIRGKSWQWAKGPADGSLTWQNAQSMHIASLSKLITAMAAVKLLAEKKISHNARIVDYLPAHWAVGPNVDQITFANLLTHQSGFLLREGTCEDLSYSDYRFMKSRVARGVGGIGNFCYANMNFGLLRVLLPIINGDIDRDATPSDESWDDRTFGAFENYIARAVFAPSHVADATLVRPSGNALAYDFPPTAPGWSTGDLRCLAGAAGWNMSLDGVLDVMSAFRRGITIISPDAAQKMLDDGFGINSITPVRTGNLYSRLGYWYRTADDSDDIWQMEQAVAVFLPEGMEIAIFANSRVASPEGEYLVSTVENAYRRHIRFN